MKPVMLFSTVVFVTKNMNDYRFVWWAFSWEFCSDFVCRMHKGWMNEHVRWLNIFFWIKKESKWRTSGVQCPLPVSRSTSFLNAWRNCTFSKYILGKSLYSETTSELRCLIMNLRNSSPFRGLWSHFLSETLQADGQWTWINALLKISKRWTNLKNANQ